MIDLSELVFDKEKILSDIEDVDLEKKETTEGQKSLGDSKNEQTRKLIKGDNLKSLKYLYENDYEVDLVYADPPFATGRTFNTGDDSDEVKQFSNKGEEAYDDQLVGIDFLQSIVNRLVLVNEILSDQGSIYLHIDKEMGSYMKVAMDGVFGRKNYLNNITRIKCNPKNFSRDAYGNQTDTILFYSKDGDHIWNGSHQEYSQEQLDRLFPKEDDDGRKFTTTPLHAPGETEDGATGQPWNGREPPEGRHWRYKPSKLTELEENNMIYWSSNDNPRKKRYADEADGPRRQDIWEFKDPQSMEYPTQKNLEMLETIVQASSNEDSLVLDPYCGGGTTLVAADEHGRQFIGMDMSDEAIDVTIRRVESPTDVHEIN